MKIKTSLTILVILAVVLSLFTVSSKVYASVSSSENYILQEDVFGIAGGESSSANYIVLSNMGEDIIGQCGSANWTMDSGFIKPARIEISVNVDPVDLGPVVYPSSDTATTLATIYSDTIGYTLNAYFSSGGFTDTMRHTDTVTYMEEKTDWDGDANGGNGNAAVWSGTGFGFTVFANDKSDKDTTWWGTGTTEGDANNKYAGFPSAAEMILESDDYIVGAQITSIGYKFAPEWAQKYGIYEGNVTLEAVTKL
ncbi:MAG: hypothetical protein U9Q67_05070 [Patescibacteria group bacterium]|nr:hypothetical protein [Patescibacteria group bacterium]